ncbi:MAG: transposase [Magnetococcales bacterium]|nr:transposase [Magnetococcales bacterium]
MSGHEFIRRFLQHVLPQGFHKIRYFGLWHPGRRALFQQVKASLCTEHPTISTESKQNEASPKTPKVGPGSPCPCCDSGKLVLVCHVSHTRKRPP